MPDLVKQERIFLLLKMWFYFKETKLQWPAVTRWLEARLNEELPESDS